MHGCARGARLSGLKLSCRVDARDLGMMALRCTPVCGETKFIADIAIILSEIHIQLDSYSPSREAVESGGCGSGQEVSKSETKY